MSRLKERYKKEVVPESPSQRVKRIARSLQNVAGTNYPVELAQDPFPNGYADGRSIAVTTGAVNLLDDDELAWVLSHEIRHNRDQHSQKRVEREEEWVQDIDNAISWPKRRFTKVFWGAVVGVGGFLHNRQGDRNEELEADQEAQRLMQLAGYNPQKPAQLLAKLEKAGIRGGGLLSKHPSTQERIENLQDE